MSRPGCAAACSSEIETAGDIVSGLLTFLWAIGGIVGYIVGAILTVLSIVRCLFQQPKTIGADEHRNKSIAGRKAKPGQFEPDLAWPLYQYYPFRQVSIDVRRTGVELLRRYRRLWRWPVDTFFRGRHGPRFVWWIFLFPIPLTVLAALTWAAVASALSYGFFVAVSVAFVAVAFAVFWTTGAILRGAERRRRRIMLTDASCPRCYLVTPWPAYQCAGCSELHRDVRPGQLGVLRRRCGCGAALPTMPLRAAWRLDAFCQRCGTPLPRGTGALRDIRIPILGDPSAGKTRFVYAGLDSLIASAGRANIEIGFPDQRSEDDAERGLAVIRSGQDTDKTSPSLPSPLNIALGTGRRQTHVHMFDAAGEVLRDPEKHDELGFLDLGQGLAYVLDPFSIGSVRDRLSGHGTEAVREAELAASDPETAFGQTVSRLRDSGVQASRQRLAVIISKVDLLRAAELDVPVDSGAIANWLTESGVHNLVLAAKRDFAEVRYFAVASQAADGGRRPDDPGAALRWLLRVHGVRLPAEAPARRPPDGRELPTLPQEDDMQADPAETTS